MLASRKRKLASGYGSDFLLHFLYAKAFVSTEEYTRCNGLTLNYLISTGEPLYYMYHVALCFVCVFFLNFFTVNLILQNLFVFFFSFKSTTKSIERIQYFVIRNRIRNYYPDVKSSKKTPIVLYYVGQNGDFPTGSAKFSSKNKNILFL